VATFLLSKFRRREMEIEQAKTLARIAREVGEPLSDCTIKSKLPGDPCSMRGADRRTARRRGCDQWHAARSGGDAAILTREGRAPHS
jgi:hypothetical protein